MGSAQHEVDDVGDLLEGHGLPTPEQPIVGASGDEIQQELAVDVRVDLAYAPGVLHPSEAVAAQAGKRHSERLVDARVAGCSGEEFARRPPDPAGRERSCGPRERGDEVVAQRVRVLRRRLAGRWARGRPGNGEQHVVHGCVAAGDRRQAQRRSPGDPLAGQTLATDLVEQLYAGFDHTPIDVRVTRPGHR